MKKIFLAIMASLLLLLAPATAFADSGSTDVAGVITYNGKHVGKGVVVTITCNGHVKTTKTNKKGTYEVQFSKKKCGNGSVVTVTATYQGHTGSNKSTVDRHGRCHRDVDLRIPVAIVPEFGTIAGIGATIAGAGAFLVIRRRQLSGHQS